MGRPQGSKNIKGVKWDQECGDFLADKLLNWIKIPTNFWLGKFAEENGFHRKRYEQLKENSEKFARAYEQAQQVQENRIVLLAMHEKINSTFAIFTLKNVAGWRDSQYIKDDIDNQNQNLNIMFFNLIKNIHRSGELINATTTTEPSDREKWRDTVSPYLARGSGELF